MVWVSPDATKMYTANIGSDSISIIERGANAQVWNQTVVPVCKGPEGFDVSSDGRELWAACSRDGNVNIVNLEQKKVTGSLELQTRRSNRLKFTPDGKLALVTDLDTGELLVVDVAAKAVTKKIPLGRMVEGILMQPDGARAYVAVNGESYIAVDLGPDRRRPARTQQGPRRDGVGQITSRFPLPASRFRLPASGFLPDPRPIPIDIHLPSRPMICMVTYGTDNTKTGRRAQEGQR